MKGLLTRAETFASSSNLARALARSRVTLWYSRSTSGDETRGVRTSYGDRPHGELWMQWANEAITRWMAWRGERSPLPMWAIISSIVL